MAKKQAVTRKRNEHHEAILCACGCGQYFDATYTTRKPRYAGPKHKSKANAPARIKKREQHIKELWRIRKQATAAARQHMKESKAAGRWPDGADREFDRRALSALVRRFEEAIKRGAK